ncbi:S1 family peptidase [Pseudoduganella namucuonensis]|uniref:Trypsin-like peptidase domain-containing protein n=1 Tax=Pseudoduganella namucuonensis TaxID=1035707 RepID=A0A1I7GFR6_9BURK|nr:serine protease [Pseudoduganella namucuonensis]SFU47347.1 Trypsin-like peptidase domain-containing protein [Pseudoduganella namucuonensis]
MPRRLFLLSLCLAAAARVAAADLSATIAAVKPSVVGVGTFQRTRSPGTVFTGTGWVVGDGLSVITNAHVVPEKLDAEQKEALGVVVAGAGTAFSFRPATLAGLDREHDLAHLRLSGEPLPALRLGDSDTLREGRDLAFTGFPLGMVLGLHHVTHRAMLSAITPVIIPSYSARQLDARAVAQLQRAPFEILQLDGTAYPGNSGSPVYDPADGTVYGVINMVFVKGLKEAAISHPSGITYAIPARHVRALLQRASTQ